MWLFRWTGRSNWFQNCLWDGDGTRGGAVDPADVWWVPSSVAADGVENLRFCRLVPVDAGTVCARCVPVDTRGYRLPAPFVALVPAEGMVPVEAALQALGVPPLGLGVVPPLPFPAHLSLDATGALVAGLRGALGSAARAVPSPGLLLSNADESGERADIAAEWAGDAALLWLVFRLEAIVLRSRAPRWRAAVMGAATPGDPVAREARHNRRAQAVRQAIGDDLSATEAHTAVLASTAMQCVERRSNDGYFVVLLDAWRRPMSHLVLEVVRYLRHMGGSGAMGGVIDTVVCNGWKSTEWLTLHRQCAAELLAAHAAALRVSAEMMEFMLVLRPWTPRPLPPPLPPPSLMPVTLGHIGTDCGGPRRHPLPPPTHSPTQPHGTVRRCVADPGGSTDARRISSGSSACP
jgi:hypothetical protein